MNKKSTLRSVANNYLTHPKNKSGITLIALVITIIVLLILAGVAISMLAGDNTILGKSTNASDNTEKSQIEERVKLAYTGALTNGTGTITTESLKEELTKEFGTENTAYTIQDNGTEWIVTVKGTGTQSDVLVTIPKSSNVAENPVETPTPTSIPTPTVTLTPTPTPGLPTGAGTKPYLPTGFKQLAGTNLSTGTTGGLVITDATGTENGNEYVWVEVPNANLGGSPTYGPDYATQGLTTEKITGSLTDAQKTKIEAALWAYTETLIARTGNNYKTTTLGWSDEFFSGCGIANAETYNTKYKNMLKSVYNYGGFWIGRYEAGIEGSDTNISLARQEHTDITSESPKAVSKIDCIPYNWVYCSEAQQLAEGVGANLMFGIQWDLILKYLQETGAVDQEELTSDSSNWGNYKLAYSLNQTTEHGYKGTLSSGDTLTWMAITSIYSHPNNRDALSTGATERNMRKNIYDLAGNVDEWALEHSTNSKSPCTNRGGRFRETGALTPVSGRGSSNPTNATSYYRF